MAEKTSTGNGELVPFTLDVDEFDQNTYYGRFRAIQKSCNPLIAFNSNAQINKMRKLIEDQKLKEEEAYKATGSRLIYLNKDQIKKIREAEVVVSTAIHPDTGDFIPWVCRLSSFLPCNVPIAFGFIIAKPTPFNTIFW